MDSLYLIIFFILGLFFGGFYTVTGTRLAEDNYHFFPYHCMECSHKLSFIDSIPIISYLLLKGKCRYCHKKMDIME